MSAVYVFIGGGIGCLVRWFFSVIVTRMQFFSFPWATLTANVISCAVFGLAIYFLGEKGAFSQGSFVRPLVLTGFCGGLSTFSTFSYETFDLLRRGDFTIAGANVLVNLILCMVVFAMVARSSAE
ncbi:MAG: fluoride efflux transporter CrcB [Bacteroidia bacterium]